MKINHNLTKILSITFLLVLGTVVSVDAQDLPRTVLGIYDSSETYNWSVDNNLIHNNAEMPLNYLGLKVELYDINEGIPNIEGRDDIVGILTWFRDEEIPHAEEYCQWLLDQVHQGKRLVILKSLGALLDARTGAEVPILYFKKILEAMDLSYYGEWTDNPFVIRLENKDPNGIEFERSLDGDIDLFVGVHSQAQTNHEYLTLRRTDIKNGISSLVVTTDKGAIALEDYALYINYVDDRRQWRIDPFLFFDEGFGTQGLPRYDTTTLFGTRIFYSHIDGDGFRNISEVDTSQYSSEIIRDEIIKRYPLPITVSYIVAEIDPRYLGSERTLEIARSITALPNVETGAHAFSHPMDWSKKLTGFPIDGYAKKVDIEGFENFRAESVYPDASQVTVSDEEFLKREITDAIGYLNENVVPEGKKVEVFQWTGDCQPPAVAIDITRQNNVKNINGGDTRLDKMYPSYTSVMPLSRQTEGRLQVYTSNANENIYSDGWEKHFHSFEYVIETIKETENPTLVDAPPRRVKPINIYYHFFIGEKILSLASLKKVYDFVLTQDIIPLFTSEFADVVEGFFSGTVARQGDGFRFRNYGKCQTVRLDDVASFPDLSRSQGILGFSRWHNYLYVHLDESQDAVLYLSESKPTEPYLATASEVVSRVQIAPQKISFVSRIFIPAKYVFHNMVPRTTYQCAVYRMGNTRAIMNRRFQSDDAGTLEIVLPDKYRGKIFVEIEG